MILTFILPPLFGFFLNAFRFQSTNKKLSGWIGVGACLISFLSVVFYSWIYGFKSQSFFILPWLNTGELVLNFSFVIDSLSWLMCLLITGVGFLIHLYSLSYMSKDSGFTRYFAYLNLFVFMMLILVLADSLPLLFVGWEGVGLCSYLLIGFWFKEKEKVQAGLMAFVVNRIGDACFLLGIFLLFFHFGTVQFSELNALWIFENYATGTAGISPAALGGFLLFLGAVGKSAQIPLYFWLPEAMAGPTPVSALIHAATMVTAGVYLLVRLSGFYSAFPDLLLVIAWIGALTALGSALIASFQWDFKKVLAYSTISQLAYLFMAVGVQAFSSSIFHLLTHGFFKALLFLCAGSVIHALSGEQDIRQMGGLKKSMPITFFSYLAGALALIAMPPFSGFFSKDEILWSLFSSGHYFLYFLALITGLCTVFYMTRLTVFVFFGKNRFQTPVHESPRLMTIPLILLALLSLLGGLMGLPHLFSDLFSSHPPHLLHELLKGISPKSFEGSKLTEAGLMLLSTGAGLAVMIGTGFYYLKKRKEKKSLIFWKKLLEEGFFVQKTIQNYIQYFFGVISRQVFQQIEQNFFNQGILFLSSQIFKLRERFSSLQSGNLQSYALYFVMGLTVLVVLVFLR